MKLSDLKLHLSQVESVVFRLPNGESVPTHFHVTEIGLLQKHYIDCGGTVRRESRISLQLIEGGDTDHSLQPDKLLKIIAKSEGALNIGDHETEVEYQGDTIGRYGLEVNGQDLQMTALQTACLASDRCGMPTEKIQLPLRELTGTRSACCAPGNVCG